MRDRMRTWLADVLTAIVFLAFSALYYFYLIPTWVVSSMPEVHIGQATLSPDLLPRITIVLFAIVSVTLGTSALRKKSDGIIEKADRNTFFKVISVFLMTYTYIYALYLVGFLIASPVFVVALVTFFGFRDWRYIVPLALLFPTTLSYFFWYSFQVILPEGSLLLR